MSFEKIINELEKKKEAEYNPVIYSKIKREYKNWKNLSERQQYDIIAAKTWQKMNEGKVILDPSGRRKLKNPPNKKTYDEQMKVLSKYEKPRTTGYAADIDEKVLKSENRVFHNKEVNLATIKDKELTNQVLKQYFENGKKMPTEADLKAKVSSGDLIYVDDYTRSDGTKVSGYYRVH